MLRQLKVLFARPRRGSLRVRLLGREQVRQINLLGKPLAVRRPLCHYIARKIERDVVYDHRLLRPGAFRNARYLGSKKEENKMQHQGGCKDSSPLRTRALRPFEQQIQLSVGRRKQHGLSIADARMHRGGFG